MPENNNPYTTEARRAAIAAKTPPRAVNVDLAKIFTQAGYYASKDLGAVASPAGGDCNHPIAVRVNAGGSITEVTSSGTRMYSGKVAGRGVRIEIDFDPETKDDPWTLGLHFHKGTTHVEILQRVSAERTLETIWRD